MSGDYTQEMKTNHMPCPRCGQWHTSQYCLDQYKYNYSNQWIPEGYWFCEKCGTMVPNGEVHTCPVHGYVQVYTASDKDLLLRIISLLEEIKNILEEVKLSE